LVQVKLAQAVVIIFKKVFLNLLSRPAEIPNIFLQSGQAFTPSANNMKVRNLQKRDRALGPASGVYSLLVNQPNYSVTARPYCCAWSAGSSAGWAHPHCQERRTVSVAET
jgi:hypothetical protein